MPISLPTLAVTLKGDVTNGLVFIQLDGTEVPGGVDPTVPAVVLKRIVTLF